MALPRVLEKKLASFTDLPSLPLVAAEIVELAQQPGVDIRAVAEAVSKDPALAAKVLRIANSALYAQRRRSNNMRQALIVLGLNATMTLALSLSVVGGLSQSKSKGLAFINFWRRSILAATWAKELASEIRRPDAEEVFLSALLQDIGMLALDRVRPELYADEGLDQSDHQAMIAHEKATLGADHAAVGGWLCKHWNLPEHIVDAIRDSHRKSLGICKPHLKTFKGCVMASGLLADAWLMNADAAAISKLAAKVHDLTGIEENKLGDLFETISAQLPVTEDVFQMKLFDHEASAQVFERAREVLIVRNLQFISEVDELRQSKESLESKNKELEEEGRRDALTNAFNRAYLEEVFAQEFETSRERAWPLSVAFVDLDYFKEVNDTHGHRAGDLILREAVKIFYRCVRDSDAVARYGGDEFVLLMPGTDHEGAQVVCDRVVRFMRDNKPTLDGVELGVTVSVGLATSDSSTDFNTAGELMEAADKALYVSKSQGRDQFTACLENAPPRRAQG
ncbi:MAG: GGDEF domain-containing protein [Gammaproteobacteria bacterium]|nr:GGDEF domain-containing protein [Gammaproteobacteria bacterium]